MIDAHEHLIVIVGISGHAGVIVRTGELARSRVRIRPELREGSGLRRDSAGGNLIVRERSATGKIHDGDQGTVRTAEEGFRKITVSHAGGRVDRKRLLASAFPEKLAIYCKECAVPEDRTA